MATIYQVSALAGVSLATVSRVMNNNAKVSDKTKQKVVDAMKELGYRPNATARSLASSRSDSVGLLVSELHGPFFGQMMGGTESELRDAGKHVIITTGHSDEEKEIDGIEFLLSRNCDALILHVEAVSDEYLIKLNKGKVPIVLINRFIEEMADSCITLDNALGGYLMTKSILEKGHTEIAYISGPKWKSDSNERIKGHKKALQEYNLPFNEQLMYQGDFTQSGGCEGISSLLEVGRPFTVLICGNDEMASGALATARQKGLDVPKDLSIVGFDNVIYASLLFPTLTTIDYPIRDMGHMAARLVLKNIYGQKKLDIRHQFLPELVERDSTISI
ncbi:transcriptional regulator [Psychrosphaera saromensis]|uniref:LacI family transcriptional regulator n=1 Tax=Psychrosphaera saromensis TaxID=716813 RepID=A0A2S7UUG9_9GAMM|nr:LacI family DNA-binding transcriptional regulator [Psychrosphaera saromensis]PQJ53583.1 LacI family transcriptional regulator [Psychrosphaera saromensis]GHB64093.1 transcriptional regulator [Psychrosphaera saromensis]GLQ15658.1 transcriptional regulator [Psychrosphaera saromensis]